MAQITPDAQYIFEESVRSDAAVSESAFQTIGGSINYLLDEVSTLDGKTLKIQEFLSNGTLNVPSDVSILLVEGCGGGGGGGGGAGAGQQGRGGDGAPFVSRIISVTPGSSHAVTIGTGGAGGPAATATFGGNGTDTTLGSLLICRGGSAGGNTGGTNNFINPNNSCGGGTGSATQGANGASRGQSTENGFYGGTPANFPTDTIGGGGGGAGPFGNGGNGGKLNLIAPQNAAANTGAGGGGGTGFFGGGNGGSGRLKVTYLSKF